ncbi:MAG TPA: hypothetical protein VGJ60_37350 [Chloroflexota bacterium]|jgi:hypothetical protein
MVVEDTSASAQAVALELLTKVSSFLGELWAIPEVRSVGIRSRPEVELWVLLDHEDVALSKRILRRHWLQFEHPGDPTLGLHVVPLDRVARDNLPEFTTIFER